MRYDNDYYNTRVTLLKEEISNQLPSLVLSSIEEKFENRGFFRLKYEDCQSDYTIVVENEIRLLNFYIYDKDGAQRALYGIAEHNNNIDELDNVIRMVSLLSYVLSKREFYLYVKKGNKLYKKYSNGDLVRIKRT